MGLKLGYFGSSFVLLTGKCKEGVEAQLISMRFYISGIGPDIVVLISFPIFYEQPKKVSVKSVSICFFMMLSICFCFCFCSSFCWWIVCYLVARKFERHFVLYLVSICLAWFLARYRRALNRTVIFSNNSSLWKKILCRTQNNMLLYFLKF